MRITKEASSQIAIKLAEKKHTTMKLASETYKNAVTEEALKQIPKEVSELYKKHPDFFRKVRSVKLIGHGFNYENVDTIEPLITNTADNYSSSFLLKMDDKLASKLNLLKVKYEKALKEYKDLVTELEIAIFGLRTYSQIEKNLPEAIPFLPKSTSMELMVNFTDLRKKIK